MPSKKSLVIVLFWYSRSSSCIEHSDSSSALAEIKCTCVMYIHKKVMLISELFKDDDMKLD